MATTLLAPGQSVEYTLRELQTPQGRQRVGLTRTDNVIHALLAIREGDFDLARRPVPALPSASGVPSSGDWFAGAGGIKSAARTRVGVNGPVHVKLAGRVQQGIPRVLAPSYERTMRRPGELGLPSYRRLHLWGPGFGDEARLGIMYGPHEINAWWQNESVELVIRDLEKLTRDTEGELHLSARALSYGRDELPPEIAAKLRAGEEFLQGVHYEFSVRARDGTVLEKWVVEFNVTKPPNGMLEPDSIRVERL